MLGKLLKNLSGISALLFFACISNVYANNLKPPIEIPFYAQKVGEIYTFDVEIEQPLTYSVEIYFYLITPNKWFHFLEKAPDPQKARHFYEILGGAKNIAPGRWVEPGVPAKFKIQIIQKDNNKILLDEVIDHPKTRASAYGRVADIVEKMLPKGAYTIRMQYLDGSPELKSIHTKILFVKLYRGK